MITKEKNLCFVAEKPRDDGLLCMQDVEEEDDYDDGGDESGKGDEDGWVRVTEMEMEMEMEMDGGECDGDRGDR